MNFWWLNVQQQIFSACSGRKQRFNNILKLYRIERGWGKQSSNVWVPLEKYDVIKEQWAWHSPSPLPFMTFGTIFGIINMTNASFTQIERKNLSTFQRRAVHQRFGLYPPSKDALCIRSLGSIFEFYPTDYFYIIRKYYLALNFVLLNFDLKPSTFNCSF